MHEPHDWTIDPRPLRECLREFGRRMNDGATRGSRDAGQAALHIRSADTYAALLSTRYETPWEPVIRLAMVEAERRHKAK